MWGADGEVSITLARTNLFIIRFPNSTARDRVLELRPWHIQNKPLIVRKWEPEMGSLDFNMRKLPVWIHLGNVSLELFTEKRAKLHCKCNPLYMDRITAVQQRLAYAKICVEIEASKNIPKRIEVELGNGSVISISVEVLWLPPKCSRCCIFGHVDKSCPCKPMAVVEKVSKPKQVEGRASAEDLKGDVSKEVVGKVKER